MRARSNSGVWLGAMALGLVCLFAVWSFTRSRSPGDVEGASGANLESATVEHELDELTATTAGASIEVDAELALEPAVDSVVARTEVERSPETVGPRKTHAQVILVGSVDSGERHPERTRVQVFADSDDTELREGASGTVLAHAKVDATFVADVTSLFIGVNALPRRLRIVAETELGCVATTDTSVQLLAEELGTPRLIQLGANIELRCTRMVTGRVVAPNAVGDVHVELERVQSHKWTRPIQASIDVANGSSFELAADMAGAFRVVASAAGHGPRIVEFAIESLDPVNLGDILLPDGATCSGTARFCGEIAAKTVVTAVPIGVRSDVATMTVVGAHSTVDRFELTTGGIAFGARTRTDENGRFEFDVLSPGLYEFMVKPTGYLATGLVTPSFEVPARGLELDVRACVLDFEFVLDPANESPSRIEGEFQLATPGVPPMPVTLFTQLPKSLRIAIPLGVGATLTANGERFDIAPCHRVGAHPLVIELGRGRR